MQTSKNVKYTLKIVTYPDASKQGGEEEGNGGDGEDEGAAVGGGGKLPFAKCEKELIIA